MASRIIASNNALAEKFPPKEMGARDLAVLIHAGMKALGWARFDDGGVMAEDGKPEISIFSSDGREFIVEVREV